MLYHAIVLINVDVTNMLLILYSQRCIKMLATYFFELQSVLKVAEIVIPFPLTFFPCTKQRKCTFCLC